MIVEVKTSVHYVTFKNNKRETIKGRGKERRKGKKNVANWGVPN